MFKRFVFGLIASVVIVLSISASAKTSSAMTDFAIPAFEKLWQHTDSLVANGAVQRSWLWGPGPGAATQEQYVDAPSGTGTRLVQYFDKSRMELNDPNGDPSSPFYVTNGLLTSELIWGRMQIGNNTFVPRFAADMPLASDVDDAQAPTYYSFQTVSNGPSGIYAVPNRKGQVVTSTINRDGQVGDDPSKVALSGAVIAYYEPATQHNIPQVFWAFLNQTGIVFDPATGQKSQGPYSSPWFFASGLPISEAYWAQVKVAGVLQPVLIQAFERRVLTYLPQGSEGFKVQMGNIGQHYYDWKYRDAGKTVRSTVPLPQAPPQPTSAVVATPLPANAATRVPTNPPPPHPPTATHVPQPTAVPTEPPSSGQRCGAICRDGTSSSATGSGACSHHGGVDHWVYCEISVP